MHRVAIVGGGTGGTALANKLAEELQPEVEAGNVDVWLITADPGARLQADVLVGAVREEDGRRRETADR